MRPLSARNPRVQRLSRLVRKREERTEQRALVVEGPLLVEAAVTAGLHVREIFVDAAALHRPSVSALLDRVATETTVWSLPEGVLDRIGDVTTSQGVLAVVEQRDTTWPTPDRARFVLVLADLAIPGNVGTVVRAAVASGAGAVVVAGGVDPTSPKVVRASAGAVFSVDVVTSPTATVAIDRLRSDGYRIVTAVVDGGTAHDQSDLGAPIALVLGSEAHGADAATVAASDALVTIAMAGPTESLNVAMAGTVLCFEILRQHRSDGS